MPLILGFFLIALMFCGAAVMASDAFTRQRDLQGLCDGAATAAASSVDFGAVRGKLEGRVSLPLDQVQDAVDAYLGRDDRTGVVTADAFDSADQGDVTVQCTMTSKLAFAGLFGKGAGVTQHASSTARSTIR